MCKKEYYKTVRCKIEGNRIVIDGVRKFLSKNSGLNDEYFAIVRENCIGETELVRVLLVTDKIFENKEL